MKNKGFEQISREFLQDSNLSLEAIGLMCNIISYSDSWVLHKTELYTRFSKNGRTSIDRSWDELVENGYILQFRRREGRSYNYQYYTSTERFNKQQIIEIAEKLKHDGFEFYHKAAKSFKSFNLSKLIDNLFNLSGDKSERTRFVEREQVDFDGIVSEVRKETSSSVEFVQSKMESPKQASKRIPNKRFTNKEIEEEDIYNKKVDYTSPAIKTIAEQLLLFDLEFNELHDVLSFLSEQESIDMDAVTQQINWMIIKSKDETGIGSFSSYFKNGYNKRVNNKNIQTVTIDNDANLPKVPMFNWLLGEKAVRA